MTSLFVFILKKHADKLNWARYTTDKLVDGGSKYGWFKWEGKNVLDELFEFKEENLCAITKQGKEKIKELVKDNDTYQMLINELDFISNDDKEKGKNITNT